MQKIYNLFSKERKLYELKIEFIFCSKQFDLMF